MTEPKPLSDIQIFIHGKLFVMADLSVDIYVGRMVDLNLNVSVYFLLKLQNRRHILTVCVCVLLHCIFIDNSKSEICDCCK
jgi:hypothetical protein